MAKGSTKHWRCPKCDNQVTTHVNLSCAPVCNNPKTHSTSRVPMEQVKKLITA